MASPQLKNGYVRLANEIYEALARFRIQGEARQILDFIIRKTYGWNKKEDVIPLSQFVLGTGMKKSNVCRAINHLIHLNLIIKSDNARGTAYRFNKDFEEWKPLSKTITKKVINTQSTDPLSKTITPVLKSDNQGMQNIKGILKNRYQKRDTQ